MRLGLPVLLICTALSIAGCGREASKESASPAVSPEVEVQQWRAKHERDYRREWVPISGLYILHPGANTVGSAAGNDVVLPDVPAHVGRFVLEGEDVKFQPAPEAQVHLREASVTSPIALRDDGQTEPDELQVGDSTLIIHKTGDKTALRVRDPNGSQAKSFQGFSWFPIDAAYRVTGRFVQDAEPQMVKVVNTYGDVDEYKTEGVVHFTLQGQDLTLRPFTTRPKRLYFVFKDASSGHETYGVARFLYADLQDDGTAVLDFNMAYNPPCSFNPFTTCPIPLKENTLPVKVLAGEKAYAGHEPEAGH